MSDFNPPGEGWRQAAAESPGVEEGRDVLIRVHNGVRTYWIREEPVPPFPTEPWTVIRARGEGFEAEFVLHLDGSWQTISGRLIRFTPKDSERITGFEVLTVPRRWHDGTYDEIVKRVHDEVRRETAKAVLDRVRSRSADRFFWTPVLDEIAREFGVES